MLKILRTFQVVFLLLSGPLALFSFSAQAELTSPLLAENEVDESYDPFADYSEFDQASDEEADINFFRNGRFFTIGVLGGYRMVTDNMAKLYQGAPAYGLYLSYFFDLRFALQVSFLTADHPISYSFGGNSITGNASITSLGMALKYYFNTQNVTRGLAALNPYVIGGFSQVFRTATVSGEEAFSKDSAFGVDVGVGIEIPMMRNKMYFGGQIAYQLVTFRDENSKVYLQNGTQDTGLYPKGDLATFLAILGVNF